MSDLFESLKQLKNKLSSMEETYENKSNELIKRVKVNVDIDRKLDKLATLQNDKVQIEAGGKVHETSRSTIENCILDNLLKDKLSVQSKFNVIDYMNNKLVSNILFIDMNSKDFKLILNLMRHFNNSDEKFNIYYDDECDKERLQTVLNYFFKGEEKLNYLVNFVKR
jgi:hypothetical protein